MVRRILASILILLGGAAALFSVAKPWYKGREGSTYQLSDLFSNIGASRASFGNSLWVPMIAAAAFALLAFAWQQGWLALIASVIVLGFTVLWIVQQTRADGQFVIASDGDGINQGVTGALIGGVLLLIGGLVMPLRGAKRSDGREQVGSGRYRPEAEAATAGGAMSTAQTAAPEPAMPQVTEAQAGAATGWKAPTPEPARSSSDLDAALKAADEVNQGTDTPKS